MRLLKIVMLNKLWVSGWCILDFWYSEIISGAFSSTTISEMYNTILNTILNTANFTQSVNEILSKEDKYFMHGKYQKIEGELPTFEGETPPLKGSVGILAR